MSSSVATDQRPQDATLRVPANERLADLERRLEAWLLIARFATPRP